MKERLSWVSEITNVNDSLRMALIESLLYMVM